MELILERMVDPSTTMTLVTTIDGTIVGVLVALGTEPPGDHRRRTEVTTGASALEVEVQHAKAGARPMEIGGKTTVGTKTKIAQCGIRIGEIDTAVTDNRAKVLLVIAIDGGTTMIQEATVDRSYGICK
jgi:hypothetical protein